MNTLVALILTFNVWGVPDIGPITKTPEREARIEAICEHLWEGQWDVVMLQEVWLEEDRLRLSQCGYRYQLRTPPSVLYGDGLLTLSHHPLERVQSRRFPAVLPFVAVDHFAEVLSRKGVQLARVRHPDGTFWVANTHMVAKYQEPDIYEDEREEQVGLLFDWAEEVAGEEPLILGGDWNVQPSDKLWGLVETRTPNHVTGSLRKCTVCVSNTHHANRARVDHLFGTPGWKVVREGKAFDKAEDVAGKRMHLSDHYGWETEFAL